MVGGLAYFYFQNGMVRGIREVAGGGRKAFQEISEKQEKKYGIKRLGVVSVC